MSVLEQLVPKKSVRADIRNALYLAYTKSRDNSTADINGFYYEFRVNGKSVWEGEMESTPEGT